MSDIDPGFLSFNEAEFKKIFGDLSPKPRLMQWECRKRNKAGEYGDWELMRAPAELRVEVEDYELKVTLVKAENDSE